MEIPFRELQHCNTATPQQIFVNLIVRKNKIAGKKIKISCEVFVNRNGNVVPLHCQVESAGSSAMRKRNPLAKET